MPLYSTYNIAEKISLCITNLKYKDYNSFYQLALLFLGDVSQNLGPVLILLVVNTNIWVPFNKKFSSY